MGGGGHVEHSKVFNQRPFLFLLSEIKLFLSELYRRSPFLSYFRLRLDIIKWPSVLRFFTDML